MMDRRREERSFGRGVGPVLIALGVYELYRFSPQRQVLGWSLVMAGAVLVVVGTFAPTALRWPSRAWWTFARALGWVNARVLLTAFFFLILTPVGVVMRLLGRNPFEAGDARTTWLPYTVRAADRHHYERQF